MSLITLSTTHRSPLSQSRESQQAITPHLGPGPLHRREETNIPSSRVLAGLQVPAVSSSASIRGGIFNTFVVFQTYYNSPNGFLRSKSSIDISCIAFINAFLLLRHWYRHRAPSDGGYFPGLHPHQLLPLLR